MRELGRVLTAPCTPSSERIHFYLPGGDVDGEQHVVSDKPEPGHGLHGEEVHAHEHAQVGLDELRPRHASPSLRCRVDTVLSQDPLDRVAPQLVTEVLQGTLDAGVAPGLVLPRHPEHQLRDLSAFPRPSRSSSLAAIVLLGHQLPIPAQDRLGRGDGRHRRQPLPPQFLAQRGQPSSLRVREADPLAAELLPEQAVLSLQEIDLLLQDATEPECQPSCQELQRQREGQTCLWCSHGAKIHGLRRSWDRRDRDEALDIMAVSSDPVSAQDDILATPTIAQSSLRVAVAENSKPRTA
jgi:hypothetical protein